MARGASRTDPARRGQHLLALPGSLRRHSCNRRLLAAAVELAPPGMEVRVYGDLAAIPLFDEDLEQETGGARAPGLMANGKLVELEPFVYVLAPLLGQRPLEPLLRRTGKERSEPTTSTSHRWRALAARDGPRACLRSDGRRRRTPEPPKDRLGQRYQRGLALARRKETAPLCDLLLERSPSILDE